VQLFEKALEDQRHLFSVQKNAMLDKVALDQRPWYIKGMTKILFFGYNSLITASGFGRYTPGFYSG
jgi:hypothetical protein